MKLGQVTCMHLSRDLAVKKIFETIDNFLVLWKYDSYETYYFAVIIWNTNVTELFIKRKAFFSPWFNMETRLNQGNVKKKKEVPDLQI